MKEEERKKKKKVYDRVGSDVNSLRLGVFNQRWVGEVWVALDLENGGSDAGSLDDGFNLQ